MVELLWDNKKEMLEEVNSKDFLKTDKHFEYNREESKNFDTTENLYITIHLEIKEKRNVDIVDGLI